MLYQRTEYLGTGHAKEEYVNEMEHEIRRKVDAYFFKKRALENRVEFWKSEVELAKAKLETAKSKLDQFKEYTVLCLAETDNGEISGNRGTLRHKPGKMKVVITEEGNIQREFLDVKERLVVNKERVKEALELGREVDGAHLEQSYTLRFDEHA
jgi:hypothetical protein